MIGGLTKGPIGLRMLTLATVAMVALLFLAHRDLAKATKRICGISTYSDGKLNKQEEKQLEKLCGPFVKVNTTQDTPYVCLLAAMILSLLTTLICGFVVVKNVWWDCYYKGVCERIDDTYLIYAVCAAFVLCFLIPTFVLVSRRSERMCYKTPASNCKPLLVNTKYMSLLQFCSYTFLVGALALVLRLVFSKDASAF